MYSFPPGGVSRRGTSTYSSVPFARAAAFDGSVADEWAPLNDDVDPHDAPAFDVGDGPPATGPSAENVIGGGDFPVAADFTGGYDATNVPANIVTE
jgi:hypothetical protein